VVRLSALRTGRLYTQEYPGNHFERLSRPRANGLVGCLGKNPHWTEISTRCISWVKGGRCVRLTTSPPSCIVLMKSGVLTFWNTLDQSWPVTRLLYVLRPQYSIMYERVCAFVNTFWRISLFHRAFQFTIYNGPTNALVCNKTRHVDISTCLSTQYNMQNEWTYAAT
jgi:hypothetical protein